MPSSSGSPIPGPPTVKRGGKLRSNLNRVVPSRARWRSLMDLGAADAPRTPPTTFTADIKAQCFRNVKLSIKHLRRKTGFTNLQYKRHRLVLNMGVMELYSGDECRHSVDLGVQDVLFKESASGRPHRKVRVQPTGEERGDVLQLSVTRGDFPALKVAFLEHRRHRHDLLGRPQADDTSVSTTVDDRQLPSPSREHYDPEEWATIDRLVDSNRILLAQQSTVVQQLIDERRAVDAKSRDPALDRCCQLAQSVHTANVDINQSCVRLVTALKRKQGIYVSVVGSPSVRNERPHNVPTVASWPTVVRRESALKEWDSPTVPHKAASTMACDEDFSDSTASTTHSESDRRTTSTITAPIVPLHVPVVVREVKSEREMAHPLPRTILPAVHMDPASVASIVMALLGRGKLPLGIYEPLTIVQILAEELAYAHLLDAACTTSDAVDRMCHVAAFAVSAYGNTRYRTRKPINPILGETFEVDKWATHGWRYVAEKVCHNPDIMACHASSKKGWLWEQVLDAPRYDRNTISHKCIEVVCAAPPSITRVTLPSNEIYTYNKVVTAVLDPITTSRFITHRGRQTVNCDATGCRAVVDYVSSTERGVHNITAIVYDRHNKPCRTLHGRWSSHIHVTDMATAKTQLLCEMHPVPPINQRIYYGMSPFAIALNEPISSAASPSPPTTDSRNRPDIRAMEEGRLVEADRIKSSLEQRQRQMRQDRHDGKLEEHHPLWFSPVFPSHDVLVQRRRGRAEEKAKASTGLFRWARATVKPDEDKIRNAPPRAHEADWWQSSNAYWAKRPNGFTGAQIPDLWRT